MAHRWRAEEGEPNAATFRPRNGYDDIRVYQQAPLLINWAVSLSGGITLKDSPQVQKYRMAYPNKCSA